MKTWLAALMVAAGLAAVGPAVAETAEERDFAVDRALGGLDAVIAPVGERPGVAPGPPGGPRLSPSVDTGGAASPAAPTAGGGGEVAAPGELADDLGGGSGPGADLGGGTGDLGSGGDLDGSADTGAEPDGGHLIDVDIDTGLGSVDIESDAEIINDLGGTTEPIPSVDVDADLQESIDLDEGEVSTEANIETGVDTSGASTGSEAELGVEADVSGGGEEDPATDPTADLGL